MTSSTGPSAPPPYPATSYPAPPSAPPAYGPPPMYSAPRAAADPADDAAAVRRRRRLRTTLVAVPALLVVAGAASFITVLVDGHGHTVAGSGTAAGTAGTTTSKHATVGTLTAENGSTWVVRTATGKTVKVDVGAKTTYGTKAHPTPASAFHTGADVKIVGAGKGSTLDAKRVVLVTGSGTGPTT